MTHSRPPARARGRGGRQPAVALLLDTLFDNYEARVLDAIRDVFRAEGVQLVAFVSGSLNSPYHVVRQRNVLYNYISPDTFDGIVSISGCIGNYVRPEDLGRFLTGRYGGLPLVSVGTEIEGIPSVYVNNATGMAELVTHLVKDHGRRRIAFITGPEGSFDARVRLDAFRRTLAEHGLDCDDRLIVTGDFLPNSAPPAVAELLDRRRVDFDALIAANDPMAAQALQTLKNRGIEVPCDVLLAGFDNVRDALSVTPSLTTVDQPTRRIGTVAAELMCALLRGESVPERTELPTRLVIRRSCGCMQPELAPPPTRRPLRTLPAGWSQLRRKAVRRLTGQFSLISAALNGDTWAFELATAFIGELSGKPGRFIPVLEQQLLSSVEALGDLINWHHVVSVLADEFMPAVGGPDTPVLLRQVKAAYLVISEQIEVTEVSRREQSERLAAVMYRINHDIVTAFTLQDLQHIAATEFRRLGLEYCFISLYSHGGESPGEELYPVTVVTGGEPPPPAAAQAGGAPGDAFPVNQLVPGGIRRYHPQSGFIVLSLFFKDEYLGVAAFDLSPLEHFAYEMLGGHLSAVLKGNQLLGEIKEYAQNLESEVASRTRDLSRVNEQLRREVAQHKHTMQVLQKRNETIHRLNAELLEKSKIDPLTTLYNREAFFELLEVEVHRVRRLSRAGSDRSDREGEHTFTVMMLDIDHFKSVNDTYGHPMGDQVLAQLGNLLSRGTILRQEDIAGRYGGEEFIVALSRSDSRSAKLPAARLMQQLNAITFIADSGESFRVRLSIGLSDYRLDEPDAGAVINRADRALYYAKKHGRNRIAVYEEIYPDGEKPGERNKDKG